jgi:hypothetical protein
MSNNSYSEHSEAEEYHDEIEDVEEEVLKKKSASKKIYTSDGVENADKSNTNVPADSLIPADCCHKYFTEEGYIHQSRYGLYVQGMNTCIHCFVAFNTHVYSEKSTFDDNKMQKEKECLTYYIQNFSTQHDNKKCMRTKYGGKCFLCEAQIGVYPAFMTQTIESPQEEDSDVVKTMLKYDLVVIKRPHTYEKPMVV